MPPAPRRNVLPLGEGPRRPWVRSRRVSALVVVATILALGGAVAAVYTTGVTLGARIAPPPDGGTGDDPIGAPEAERPSSTTTGGDDGSLPDRVEGSASSTTGPGSTTRSESSSSSSSRPSEGPAPVEPYPGLWPYVSWDEVTAHAGRGDARYRTPADTALRFATEVVGLTDATVGTVAEDGVVGWVEVRSGSGSTLVTLTHATAGETTASTPWSVVEATGSVGLDLPPTVADGALRARSTGAPGVVGVHDRTRWRGIGVAPTPGAPFDVRLDPGVSGPAIAVAFAGDPRQPSSFTVRRVHLRAGAGVVAPGAPADPVAAARALVEVTSRGDVGATWELLDEAARRAVLDWRGLAGRLPRLRDQVAGFGMRDLTTTTVTTSAGPVAVVAPAIATDGAGPVGALAFRIDDGARLASTAAGSVTWTGPTAEAPGVVAVGAVRPLALVLDGVVWASTPDGATGLRAATDALAPGPHVAVAITEDGGQVTASAFRFTAPDQDPLSDPDPDPDPDPPPPSAPAAPGPRDDGTTTTSPPTTTTADPGA
ncbi:hypothetical protein HC251_15040 [Iamia sp. SCSIO 61187]|uniref:hypothetical protein n=1 Tax=Iamia sp. SCSIO 61187 TaxID=2722752 RepID=UPI001C62770E|nr:hypothetical protein [Iamia sp. SCSIO 61187]QYG93609.1 hypothetical protein HC251_15040 [Iamia sp. SCSIO 61187]